MGNNFIKKEEKILGLKEILYSNFNDFNNEKVKEIAEQLVNLISNGDVSINGRFESVVMDSYKFLSEVEYLGKNYKSCLIYINKLESIKLYKKESSSTINHATVRRLQCEIMLEIYKNSNDKIKILKKQLVEFGDKNRDLLESTLRDDYDKILDLATSYLNNSVKTVISFKLPYKIDIPEEEEISYNFNSLRFSLKFKKIINEGQLPFEVSGGVVELDKDKYGVVSYSDLVLTFNKFFDATHDMDGLLKLCSASFNYFLNYYKHLTQYYWLDNLNLNHIQASNVRVISERYDDIISIPFYYGHTIKVSSMKSYLNKETINKLEEQLKESTEINLWRNLYYDSKNYTFIEKYREALISINSAFENYLNIISREILSTKMTEVEVEEYLCGKLNYDTYYLKEFITQESFNKAIEQQVITPYAPNTFQVIKKCIELDENNRITLSKNKINKLVNYIRKNRNDLIHGNLSISNNIKSDVEKSISSFEEFIKVFK